MERTLIFDLSRDPIRQNMLKVAQSTAPTVDFDTLDLLVSALLDALMPEFRTEYRIGFSDGESEHAHDEWRKNWATNKMGPY